MRKQLSANITNIDFVARLWPCFRALISGALDDLKVLLGDTVPWSWKRSNYALKASLCKPCNLTQEYCALSSVNSMS